jgi:tetratricopeptide (TPR) repeat protein
MLPALHAASRDDLIVSLLQELHRRHALSTGLLRPLAAAYESSSKLNEARASLEQFAAEGNMSTAVLFDLARIARKQQDYQGALGYLAHARDLEPSNASIHYYFGVVCLDLSLVAEARNSFEKAVKLEPENASFNYALGAASAFRRDPEEAVPYFQKYLQLKPEDPRGRLALGAAFYRAKNYEAAIPWLREASKVKETATTAHYYLGAIAVQQRRFDDALPELQQALKANPEYTDAMAELGQYYLLRKDYVHAGEEIRHALKLDPDHFAANFNLLTLYTRTGDSRREAQEKHFGELQKRLDEKTQEILRIVEVRPLDNP